MMSVEHHRLEFKSMIKDSRGVGETICAMANSAGGRIEVGKTSKGSSTGLDAAQADEVQRRAFDALEMVRPQPRHRIEVEESAQGYHVVIHVQSLGERAFCTVGGIVYVRSGSVNHKLDGDALKDFLARRMVFAFDELASDASTADVDMALLRSFLEIRNPSLRFEPARADSYLAGMHALDQLSTRLRNGAVLFFTREPRRYIRQHELRLVRFASPERIEIIDRRSLEAPVPEMIEEAVAFVRRNTATGIRLEGLRGVDVPEYPWAAVREAIINMVAHRDYLSRDACQVNIHPDRIEFLNPGVLPFGLTIETLGSVPVHRNPLIYDLMRDADLMEGVGTGIAKMRELTRSNGLPPVEFSEVSGFFRVTMRNRGSLAGAGRAERREFLLNIIRERGPVSTSEISAILGVTPAMALIEMNQMISDGLVEKIGKTRGARYRTKK
jgi:ATP-dependent DNA helicase RecG